jgi:hypothetical protein
LPWLSASGVAPTWVRFVPLKPKSMVTTACRGSLGSTGAAAGCVPWVITSGSYTLSCPFLRFRIVACTNAPRLATLAMVQPEASGDIPSGPVSWYGVARPWALSGLGGTMMSHDTLAAAAAALAVAVAVGHGVAVAAAVGAAVAGAVAGVVAADVAAVGAIAAGPVAAGVAVLVLPAAVVAGAVLSGAAVLAWVPAWAAAALGCVLVVGAAEVAAVAQSPATLAVLLEVPNRLRGPISRAKPTPITSTTTPTIAISLRRDRPEPQVSG